MIFLAFANDPQQPLPTLSREDDEVFRVLSIRAAQHHYRIHRESHATLAKIAEYLIRFRADLRVFHYSGHAGRDRLFLEDQEARSEGMADLLGQCPKLRLVVLNGCSTAGQVQQLLDLPNQPAVIATSAPVQDWAATQFAISFYQTLSEQAAIVRAAFQSGLAAAKAATQQSIPEAVDRGIALRASADAPVWLLDGPPERLDWKLPAGTPVATPAEIQPNQLLLKGLLHSLADFDPRAREAMEQKPGNTAVRGRRRLKRGDNERRNIILKCLPLPISEQVEKLVAKRRENRHVFYDSFSYDRLKQLLLTYEIAMELPAFILLAQLFDLLAREEGEINMSPTQRQHIQNFLQAPYEERLRDHYFPLLAALTEVLQQNKIPLFVTELAELRVENDEAFHHAFRGLELKKARRADLQHADAPAITQACIEAEQMLTQVLSRLSFLAAYSLVSVRNIDVLRNRLFRTPSFVHRVVHLAKKDAGDPEEVEELLDDFLDNESVLLMQKQPLSGQTRFLNLTPFVIDENAYVKKASEIKLHYFHHFQPQTGAYYFKHTYKPEDPLLEICEATDDTPETENTTQDIWEQFEDFQDLLQAVEG